MYNGDIWQSFLNEVLLQGFDLVIGLEVLMRGELHMNLCGSPNGQVLESGELCFPVFKWFL